MKNVFLVLCLAFGLAAFSQTEAPPYKQNKTIPIFELQQVDKPTFSTGNLKKNTPTLIMFFSPGCDHCIHQFEDMVKRLKDFKNSQIVMATWQPIEELAEFNKKYQISKYSNITTGRDTNYFLPPFYQISSFPYMAFYDKSGKLNSVFEGNMKVDDMLKRLK